MTAANREPCVKVSIFTVVMLLVAAGLVVVFGEFRFALGQHLPRHLHRRPRG